MIKNSLVIICVGLFLSCAKDAVAPSFDQQLSADLSAINSYLSSKGIVAQNDPDNYGVKYVITKDGSGINPTSSADSITVNYTFKLLPSEQVIQKSTSSVKFLLGDLIPGWQIGLPLIKEGSIATFYIPSVWGYGSSQTGSGSSIVPANSNLIYDIELIKVVSRLTKDTVAINTYLNDKGIANVRKDPSGLRYVITTLGTGTKPTSTSTITFNYVGKFMNTAETIFDQSTSPATAPLANLIKGFRIAMPLLPAGTKATLYIPSPLGYGLNGDRSGTVPSNANLIFDVELVSVN
jgi:FKBP-type peptidyl-prolyl cis-trans isomerase